MKKLLVLTIVSILSFISLSYAHPGNTASDGCHYCRTNCDKWGVARNERHCHGGSTYVEPVYVEPTYVEPVYVEPVYVAPIKTPIEECQSSYGIYATYDNSAESCICKSGYALSSTGKSCIKALTCKSGYILSSTGKSCIKKLTCRSGYILSSTGKSCIKKK